MTHFIHRLSCPGCGETSPRTVLSLDYVAEPLRSFLQEYYPAIDWRLLDGERYILSECPDCGLVYQVAAPTGALAAELYEKWVDPEISRRKKLDPSAWRRHRRLSEELSLARVLMEGLARRPRVLDFGLGWGDWVRMAAAYGCEVHGVELSREKQASARASGIKVLEPAELSVDFFDYINIDQVLEHLPDPAETMRLLAHCLRPGGFLHVAVPNCTGIARRVSRLAWTIDNRRAVMPVQPLEHLNCFSHGALVSLGRRFGLEEFHPPLTAIYRHQLAFDNPRTLIQGLGRPLVRRFISPGPKIIFKKTPH